MKTRTRSLIFSAILGLSAAATPLVATTTEYSSLSAWTAAVTGITAQDFEGISPGGSQTYNALSGYTSSNITITEFTDATTLATLTRVNANVSQPYYDWGTGAILRGDSYQGALAHLHIAFSTAVTAWGTNLMTGSTNGGTYTVKVNGTTCITPCSAPTFNIGTTPAFFGMTSDIAFSTVDLYFPINTYPVLDNFSFATANTGGGGDPGPGDPGGSDTPEVATVLLCATGLFAMAKIKKLQTLTPA